MSEMTLYEGMVQHKADIEEMKVEIGRLTSENERLKAAIWPLCDVDGCTTSAYFANPTRCNLHWKRADMVGLKAGR